VSKKHIAESGNDSYESDLIYFAIKATRAKGREKVHFLKHLKELAKAEYEYHKARRRRKET
jgi:hypothetical protein